jgi:MFS family permease
MAGFTNINAVSAHSLSGRPVAVLDPRLKAALFAIEGLNSISTTYFFYYIYFLMKERFGFDDFHNFLLASGQGLAYAVLAIWGGRFAQKRGYFLALGLGLSVMSGAWLLAPLASGAPMIITLMITATLGMCFTWPTLEALVTEGEPSGRIPKMLGIYNVVWAVTAAFAFFTGGVMIKHWGWNAMFLVPAGVGALELILAIWVRQHVPKQRVPVMAEDSKAEVAHEEVARSPISPKTFQKMAWLANPLAYLAINTLLPVLPTIAGRLNVDTATSGFLCSIWMFTRSGSFAALWFWPKWHYRFRFLAGAFVVMVGAFGMILLIPQLWALIVAQVFFGLAVGLIYYSSLFYSMDSGDAKGEHGGIHEGAIGAGNCLGPAMAAGGVRLFQGHPAGGAWAVILFLLAGLGALYWLRYRDRVSK